MGIYQKHVLPRATHFLCGLKPAMKQRAKVVPLASGRVLEIGIGTGLNLPFYSPGKVEHLWGLDPAREMWTLAEDTRNPVDFDMEYIEASASDIPLETSSVDTAADFLRARCSSRPRCTPLAKSPEPVLDPAGWWL
jgi:ubiquinone/menaquinone biosynthesis C-methylase UbiE